MRGLKTIWLPLTLIVIVATGLGACGGDDRDERPDSERQLDADGELQVEPLAVGASSETLVATQVRRRGEGRLLVAAQIAGPVPQGIELRLTADHEPLAEASQSRLPDGSVVISCLCDVDEGPTDVALEAQGTDEEATIGARSLAAIDGVAPATTAELDQQQAEEEVPLVAQALSTEGAALDAGFNTLLSADSERTGTGLLAVTLLENAARTDPETIVVGLRSAQESGTLEREITKAETRQSLTVFSSSAAPEVGERLVVEARIVGGGSGAIDAASLFACACGLVE